MIFFSLKIKPHPHRESSYSVLFHGQTGVKSFIERKQNSTCQGFPIREEVTIIKFTIIIISSYEITAFGFQVANAARFNIRVRGCSKKNNAVITKWNWCKITGKIKIGNYVE